VNHDLAGYEVPVHADIPHQDVIFFDEVDDKSSPIKAKRVGEVGLCGVGAVVANAVYNATGPTESGTCSGTRWPLTFALKNARAWSSDGPLLPRRGACRAG